MFPFHDSRSMVVYVEVIINAFVLREQGRISGYSICFTPSDSPGGEMRPHQVNDLEQLGVLLRHAGL